DRTPARAGERLSVARHEHRAGGAITDRALGELLRPVNGFGREVDPHRPTGPRRPRKWWRRSTRGRAHGRSWSAVRLPGGGASVSPRRRRASGSFPNASFCMVTSSRRAATRRSAGATGSLSPTAYPTWTALR